MEKRHLIAPVRNALIVVFIMNMFLAVGMEESIRGLITSVCLITTDLLIYRFARRYE